MSGDERRESVVPLKGRPRKAAATGWLADCICNEKRKPLPVLANALIGVRAVWPDAIAYDEMQCVPMLMRSLTGENNFAPRPLTDIDVGIMQTRLQHLGLYPARQRYHASSGRHPRA